MMRDPYEAPPATLCDPNRLRDLNPAWSCDVPGCDCGSTPSDLDLIEDLREELRFELRLRYDILALDRELEELRAEARRHRDGPWLRFLRWLQRVIG